MSDEIDNDGETLESKLDSADGSGLAEETVSGIGRLNPFAKEGENPEECPKGFIPMYCATDMRVALTNGNIYTFPAGKCVFVQKRDKNACAGRGAAVMDSAAIEKAAQAEADAKELAELRKEKQERLAAEAAKSKEDMVDSQNKDIPNSAAQQNAEGVLNSPEAKADKSTEGKATVAAAKKTTAAAKKATATAAKK